MAGFGFLTVFFAADFLVDFCWDLRSFWILRSAFLAAATSLRCSRVSFLAMVLPSEAGLGFLTVDSVWMAVS